MKDKVFKTRDLCVVCLCKYFTVCQEGDSYITTHDVVGFYIADYKKTSIINNIRFKLLTKNNLMVEYASNAFFSGAYGVEEYTPLPLCADNLQDKISYSQIVALEKNLANYFNSHKHEIEDNFCDCNHDHDKDHNHEFDDFDDNTEYEC